MASPYAYHTHQNAMPPAAHRGISPALSTRSGIGGGGHGAPANSGYNPAMYQGSRLRRTSNSPMRDMDPSVVGASSPHYNPQEYGPVSGNSGAFVPTRPGESDIAPPPYSPPASQNRVPLPPRDHRNPGLHIMTPPHRRDPSIPQTARMYSSGHGAQSPGEQSGWRTGFTPTSAPVMRTTFSDNAGPPNAARNTSVPPPPPPGPPPPGSRSTSVAATPDRIPPPPPGPPPRDRSSSRTGRRSTDGGRQTAQPMSQPMETIHSAGGIPPIPPKRKIEEEEGSYRDHQRASPKQKEEESRQRGESDGANNPWRNGTSTRVSTSPPRETPKVPDPPLIDLAQPRPSQSSTFQRKASTPRPSALDTGSSLKRNGGHQLPTPPPQHSSPTASPDQMVFSPIAAGPSKGKEPVEAEQGFLGTAKRRYREMLAAEDVALTDGDKLRLFLTFVTKECEIRMDLYTDTVNTPNHQKLARIIAILTDTASEHSLTPVSPVNIGDIDDSMDVESPSRSRREMNWWGPNSMSLEQRIKDEESSRGRTSSRWWETSHGSVSESMVYRSDGMADDDVSFGFGRRSKKRSKKPRASLREIAECMNTPRNSTQAPNAANPASYMGSAAYPPDRKPHSQSRSRSRAAHSRTRAASRRRPVKVNLDIAPLLTLLPPYPKDYPAVNNSHPSLEVFRSLVRTLNQLDSLKDLRDTFSQWQEQHKANYHTAAVKRRNAQAERVQSVYTSSRRTIDYNAIEKLNVAFEANEMQLRTQYLQDEFDHFTRTVVDPAHRDLHERITAATAAYNDLSAIIDSPTPAPTEGDDSEPPELHEKLTALKWLFDVRELLHKHIFDLLTQRNDMYKVLVTTPLPDTRAAEDFFKRDEEKRAAEHEKARNTRHNQFVTFVESQVTKGVESARSQYWDIAPLVQESLAKIPENLTNVVPIVPPEEGHQDPELRDSPMLYLQRKLKLARDAMYTIIEAQTELLCLLHDAKSRGEVEEERLTRDLKEKVGMVEDEWREGLGDMFDAVKSRVDAEVEKRGLPVA